MGTMDMLNAQELIDFAVTAIQMPGTCHLCSSHSKFKFKAPLFIPEGNMEY